MPDRSGSLADVLERVLDKGVVIVGDIGVSVVDVELLTLRLRLFIASAQTAREMGLDWWTRDPFFSGGSSPEPIPEKRTEKLETVLSDRREELPASREERTSS